jgi:hypothetical protein
MSKALDGETVRKIVAVIGADDWRILHRHIFEGVDIRSIAKPTGASGNEVHAMRRHVEAVAVAERRGVGCPTLRR